MAHQLYAQSNHPALLSYKKFVIPKLESLDKEAKRVGETAQKLDELVTKMTKENRSSFDELSDKLLSLGMQVPYSIPESVSRAQSHWDQLKSTIEDFGDVLTDKRIARVASGDVPEEDIVSVVDDYLEDLKTKVDYMDEDGNDFCKSSETVSKYLKEFDDKLHAYFRSQNQNVSCDNRSTFAAVMIAIPATLITFGTLGMSEVVTSGIFGKGMMEASNENLYAAWNNNSNYEAKCDSLAKTKKLFDESFKVLKKELTEVIRVVATASEDVKGVMKNDDRIVKTIDGKVKKSKT